MIWAPRRVLYKILPKAKFGAADLLGWCKEDFHSILQVSWVLYAVTAARQPGGSIVQEETAETS